MDEIKKARHACVDEFYLLEKGVIIQNPDAEVLIGDCRITRRQFKHVVELIPEVILRPDFEAPNYSQNIPEALFGLKLLPRWIKPWLSFSMKNAKNLEISLQRISIVRIKWIY